MATWNTEVMAVQNGTEVSTDTHEIIEYEVIEHTTGTYTTKHKAIGATGAEIGFVYAVNDDGTYGKQLLPLLANLLILVAPLLLPLVMLLLVTSLFLTQEKPPTQPKRLLLIPKLFPLPY